MRPQRVAALSVGFLIATYAVAADQKPIPGIGPVGEVVKLHTGFKFTEGPAADPEGNVYFSDIPNNRVHKVDTDGKLTTFLEDSKGCNGLMFDSKGRMLACQNKTGRVIAIDPSTKEITVVAEKFEGKPFTEPNDLVIDRQNGVYFTDMQQHSIFYVAPDGKVTRLVNDATRANGVILSPDEKTMYSLPAGATELKAFPVTAPGQLGEGKAFGKLEQPETGKPGGGDGMAVDTKGNLYVTRPAMKAIQVMSPEGKTLGMIEFPEFLSNCKFGGKDMRTLYVTTRTSVYAVKMEAAGHRFATGR